VTSSGTAQHASLVKPALISRSGQRNGPSKADAPAASSVRVDDPSIRQPGSRHVVGLVAGTTILLGLEHWMKRMMLASEFDAR